jgi:AcrR family transcriptional regulator
MPKPLTKTIKPRKHPIQQRSSATVEAIYEATIQVLLKHGIKALTTTRVAERAGVSVGTLYQYYPNKESILYAVLEQHLARVTDGISTASSRLRGLPLKEMIEGFVDAFIDEKMHRPDVSRALYTVSSELNAIRTVKSMLSRTENEVIDMLASVPGAPTERLPFIAMMLSGMFAGASKAIMERGAVPRDVPELRRSLKVATVAYLENEFARK